MNYRIDIKKISDGNAHIHGWCLPKDPKTKVNIKVFVDNTEIKNLVVARRLREDVAEVYLKNYDGDKYFGFSLEFPFNEEKVYKLVLTANNEKIVEKIDKENIKEFNSFEHKKKEQLLAYFNFNTFKRAFVFFFEEGPKSFIKKTIKKINGIHVDYDYSEWKELTKTSNEELEKQTKDDTFTIKPKFSIVIPVFDIPDVFLKLLFDSIFNQTYSNFEVCIADATDYTKNKNNPKCFFEKEFKNKTNVFIKYLTENKSIADNTNEAISMATGDYVVLCDHDDELELDALYENAKVINNNKNVNFIYSDEDKVDTKSNEFFEPAFKSDFNLDMLLSVNYFCHLAVIKKSILDRLKSIDGCYERAEYNGAQDYDLFLRIVNLIINDSIKNVDGDIEYDTSSIHHIPKVLYHWRCHKLSTAKNVDSKLYAFANGEKALKNFYDITKINFPKVVKIEKGYDYGIYHTTFDINCNPLVSVIIPNKDHSDDLNTAIMSLLKGNYKNLEFIICENNSTDNKTFEYYDKIQNDNTINCKVVTYKPAEGETFNYSKLNNYAVKYSSGDYLLFLNNDIEMISPDSIYEMLCYAIRDDVGAVGAKLLYKDKTIQHAGVVLGFGGVAGHTFIGLNDFDNSYMNRVHFIQNYNAVTAACLMTKRKIFDKIGGFDESIAVAFNDIDLCLNIRKINKLIVYNSYSSFYHYESKSRGYEDTKEKVDRFNRETAFMLKKWKNELSKIDNYYNPNLTLRKSDFSLRNLKFEKIGEVFPIPEEIDNIIKTL